MASFQVTMTRDAKHLKHKKMADNINPCVVKENPHPGLQKPLPQSLCEWHPCMEFDPTTNWIHQSIQCASLRRLKKECNVIGAFATGSNASPSSSFSFCSFLKKDNSVRWLPMDPVAVAARGRFLSEAPSSLPSKTPRLCLPGGGEVPSGGGYRASHTCRC